MKSRDDWRMADKAALEARVAELGERVKTLKISKVRERERGRERESQ